LFRYLHGDLLTVPTLAIPTYGVDLPLSAIFGN
jgi:hypothetical protein